MTETQLKSYPRFQTPRERLALLLEQLSELDDPLLDKAPKLEAVPARKPEEKLKPERVPAKKTEIRLRPASKPDKKLRTERRPDRNSFHSVLRESAKKQAGKDPEPVPVEPSFGQWLALTKKCALGALRRVQSLLQGRNAKSATKRLRLSEVVPLGEKRFVAIVKVEDREFLIGGAASGLSLLAQLGKNTEPAGRRNRETWLEGHSR